MRTQTCFVTVIVLFVMTHSAASAITLDDTGRSLPSVPSMQVGEQTRAPMGFAFFCETWPEECDVHGHGRGNGARGIRASIDNLPPALTAETWNQLQRVDAEVDKSILPLPADDAEAVGASDIWSLAPKHGDCEDFVLTKRHRLMESGWPSHSLLIAVVRDDRGRSHAVLVVHTDRGDFVLDNLLRRVMPWNKLRYRWIKRQSMGDPRRWVKLEGYDAEMLERLEAKLWRLAGLTGMH